MRRYVCLSRVSSQVLLLGLLAHQLPAQQAIQVVNAASYAPSSTFAPGTIVTILGANLTNTVLAASNTANPPTTLGGVAVTVGGVAAGLFFVSPGQINARIDPSVPQGSATVVVTSPTGQFTTTITISINAAAGLFSIAGAAGSEGAVLNAITFALGPFTVTSAMGPPGSPVGPTVLAIFLTGLNLSASPQVTIGGMSVPVVYFGNAPCCAGLEQINVQLVSQLAGAGRVPVVVTAAGVTSNVVNITIQPNATPSTPAVAPLLSGVVAIPNTSLGLVSDTTDDVVEVVNTSSKTVVTTITLPQGAAPGAIAVNSTGTLATVVEHKQNAVAILDLQTFKVLGQVNVGHGPVAVAIAGNVAFVVNEDSDSVTAINLSSLTLEGTIAVGRSPSSITVDTARNRLLITNSGSGTISVIDLASLKVTSTVSLSLNARPLSIRVAASLDLAVITDASLKPGQIFVVDLLNDTSQVMSVSGTLSGSWNAAAVMGNKVILTDSVDGEIGVLTFSRNGNKQIAFTSQLISVAPGVESLDVDTAHALLIITQSNGMVLIFNLNTNATVADIEVE